MHELSIAQALVEQAQDVAKQNKANRIAGITVAIGALSAVDCGALEFVFAIAAEGTIAESASLTVEAVQAEVKCRACGQTSNPELPFFACTKCSSNDVEITGGREMTLKSVDVE